MNDDELRAQLERRANLADPGPGFAASVRDAIDTRPVPVRASRIAPLAGLVGIAASLVLLVIALPRLTPAAPPVAPSDTPNAATPRVAPRAIECAPGPDPRSFLPTIVDEIGVVIDCAYAVISGDILVREGPGAANPRGNQMTLIISWPGTPCDAAATFTLRATGSRYAAFGQVPQVACEAMLVFHSVRVSLSLPLPADHVDATLHRTQAQSTQPPSSAGSAWWELAPDERPTDSSTELRLVVYEYACASGSSPEGRIEGPTIEYGASEIAITFEVRPLPGGQDCPSAPGAPVTVTLTEPLGNRGLVDGNAGAVVIERDAGFLALSSGHVDALARGRFQALVGQDACISTVEYDRYVPTQAELEAMAAQSDGEGLLAGGWYLGDWLGAARAFGAIEAYEGRPKPWYIVRPDGALTLVSLDPFPISGGRTLWYAGFYRSTLAVTCGAPPPSAGPEPTRPLTTTINCQGAPVSPESGSVSIDDHTGSVEGCTVRDGRNPAQASLTSAGAPPRLTIEWVVPCASDPMVSRIELWRRPATAGPTSPSGFRPPYLLMVNRSKPAGSFGCFTALSGRTVELQLREFISSNDVEMFFTDGAGQGFDSKEGDGLIPNLELSISASQTEYTEGEAIEVASFLVADYDVTLNCGGHPIIAMEQLDGPLAFYPGPFILSCPPPTDLRGGEPLTRNFLPAVWALSGPHSLGPYIRDDKLYLPPGAYRFFALANFDVGRAPQSERVELEASVVVMVR